MAFYNDKTEKFTLTASDGKEYTYNLPAGSILVSDNNNVLNFHIGGKDYYYKSADNSHSAAADVIKNAGRIALVAGAGAALGIGGIVAGAAGATAYEIANHFGNHARSGYFNNGSFIFHGPVKW